MPQVKERKIVVHTLDFVGVAVRVRLDSMRNTVIVEIDDQHKRNTFILPKQPALLRELAEALELSARHSIDWNDDESAS